MSKWISRLMLALAIYAVLMLGDTQKTDRIDILAKKVEYLQRRVDVLEEQMREIGLVRTYHIETGAGPMTCQHCKQGKP